MDLLQSGQRCIAVLRSDLRTRQACCPPSHSQAEGIQEAVSWRTPRPCLPPESCLGGTQWTRQTSSRPRTGYSSPRDSSLCTVTDWTPWTACSQTCDRGSQSRSRSYPNPTGAQIGNCDVKLLEKRVCNSKRKCKDKTYGGGFDPFFSTDELVSGYSSPWSRRGLSSQSLTEEQTEPKSYLYDGRRASPQVGSPSSYSQRSSTVDPYSDPFNQLSGYEAKGLPAEDKPPFLTQVQPLQGDGLLRLHLWRSTDWVSAPAEQLSRDGRPGDVGGGFGASKSSTSVLRDNWLGRLERLLNCLWNGDEDKNPEVC